MKIKKGNKTLLVAKEKIHHSENMKMKTSSGLANKTIIFKTLKQVTINIIHYIWMKIITYKITPINKKA
ncbi:hypothetical protein AOR09_20570 [Vibrio alginolyticus]|nr:hypothetical protein AOR09_20570 [Vibrio alginolyticus]KPM95602.1 hypothetical protein AOG25_23920 [Vibrio alginolyticus]